MDPFQTKFYVFWIYFGVRAPGHSKPYCVSLFSDYTRKVTMQNLFHDGGFSYTGMSETAMKTYLKVMEDEKNS